MKFRLIEAFRAMVECGTVSAAARSLRISQPAMTKLIAQLQEELNLELFERQSGRLVPTPEALALVGSAERTWHSISEFVEAAKDIREFRRGRLRIVACPSFASTLLPEFVAMFAKTAPRATLELYSQSSQRVIDWTADGQADVGIAVVYAPRRGVRAESLGKADALCILPAEHQLASKDIIYASDLQDEVFISLSDVDSSRSKIDAAFWEGAVQPDTRVTTPQSSVALGLVANGMGVSIVDPATALLSDSRRVVVRPFRPVVTFEFYMYHPAHRTPSQLQEQFVKSFRRWCQSKLQSFSTSR